MAAAPVSIDGVFGFREADFAAGGQDVVDGAQRRVGVVRESEDRAGAFHFAGNRLDLRSTLQRAPRLGGNGFRHGDDFDAHLHGEGPAGDVVGKLRQGAAPPVPALRRRQPRPPPPPRRHRVLRRRRSRCRRWRRGVAAAGRCRGSARRRGRRRRPPPPPPPPPASAGVGAPVALGGCRSGYFWMSNSSFTSAAKG